MLSDASLLCGRSSQLTRQARYRLKFLPHSMSSRKHVKFKSYAQHATYVPTQRRKLRCRQFIYSRLPEFHAPLPSPIPSTSHYPHPHSSNFARDEGDQHHLAKPCTQTSRCPLVQIPATLSERFVSLITGSGCRLSNRTS